jgi:hypothetical protein
VSAWISAVHEKSTGLAVVRIQADKAAPGISNAKRRNTVRFHFSHRRRKFTPRDRASQDARATLSA